ncbi:MAG TPA: SRPBCC family protein [Streptomyces sp.]|nr:SRPBCC family protein [Streptomyces sp.]
MSARSNAAPSTVQRLLLDMSTWTRWQPFDSVEAIPTSSERQGPAETDTAWALRKGRIRTDIEIVDVVPDRGISYVTLRLVGMREYRADISLTPLPHEGTDIRWRATFTPTLPILSRLWEWYLDRSMRNVVGALARHAEL